jgi:hypothetical protein
MNFIKKHYEKVLLGAVLLGLAVAAVLLPFKVATEEADLKRQREEIMERGPGPLPPLSLNRSEEALKRLQDPAGLNFAKPHNLFNPGPWQKAPDGTLTPVPAGREFAVEVVKVTPLYLTITLDPLGASGSNYLIKVERDAETTASKRKQSEFLTLNVKPSRLPVTLRSVKGPSDKPTELILEMSDTGERVSVAFDRPHRQVDGYTADLKSENKIWAGQRKGAKLPIAGDEFTIVAINLVATNQFEVVLSAKSTLKKYTAKFEKKDDENQKAAAKPGTAP